MSKKLLLGLVPPLGAALIVGAFGVLSGNEANAARDSAISSSTDGALAPPAQWNCDSIYPEYKEFLDAGNAPEKWRHMGKVYRDEESRKTYTWRDWIDWANASNCGGQADLAKPEMSSSDWLGLVIPQFGAGLIAADKGDGPKSPG